MLKLQFRDRRQEAIWLVDPLFTVGSDKKNSLVVNDTSIAKSHANIRNNNNNITIEPLEPSAAIYINNEKISGIRPLTAGDTIKLGNIELDVIDPQSTQYKSAIGMSPSTTSEWKIKSTASWMENKTFPIEGKTTLGREASCDISIPVEHLSRRHVELNVKGGKLIVKDLNSSNGTFLNGQRITEIYAKPGDKIKLDVITFEVIGPETDSNKTIIRSAKVISTPNKNSRLKPEKSQINKASTQKKKQAVPSVKKPRLGSKGKQPWIEEPTITQSKTNYRWYAIAGFSITLLCIVIFLSLQ